MGVRMIINQIRIALAYPKYFYSNSLLILLEEAYVGYGVSSLG